MPRSKLIDYYMGEGTDHAGRLFDAVVHFSDGELEHEHDYIQWLFPVPEPSRFQPQSPLLTEDDIEKFRESAQLRWRVIAAAARMWRFYEESPQWKTPNNHNLLRITRILRFLTLIGAEELAMLFYTRMVQLVANHPDVGTLKTLFYWREALKKDPAWLA
jgi:hypothetical protein